jgi:hypothetical protein
MSQYEGFVFSLPREMIERAISEKRDVFVKYCSWDIRPNRVLYLYDTGEKGSRQIVARANISSVDRVPAKDVWERFESRIIPNKKEYEEYISERESREVVVMELDELSYLNEPADPPGNITVAGLTLDKERHQKIKDQI